MNTIQSMGEIVSWKPPSEVPLAALRSALLTAGLPDDLAKDLIPRNAFSRAARKLQDGRVIDKVNETKDELVFQFTAQYLAHEAQEMRYSKECYLVLNKHTGSIDCSIPTIRLLAIVSLQQAMDTRTANDITRIVQKVFEKHNGELIQIRDQGGVYFVPSHLSDVLDQVDTFLLTIGGSLRRFKITPDGGKTDASVASSIYEYFQGLLSDLRGQCDKITSDASDTAKANAVRDFSLLRGKLGVYSGLLADFSKEIESGIGEVESYYNTRLQSQFEPEPPVPEAVLDIRQRLAKLHA